MSGIERKSRTLIKHGTIIDYYQDEMVLPDGSTELWDIIEHRLGAAAIVPVTEDGRIILVRQTRPAIGKDTWEIPAGTRDAVDEPHKECAKRELTEETGYVSERIDHLISLNTTVAFSNEFVEVYIALDCKPTGQQHLDPAEDIRVAVYDMDSLKDMILSGEITDGKTISGILAAELYMKKHGNP